MLFEVGKRVQRRLRVARASQGAGKIARLLAQVSRFCPEKRLDESKERAPALHRPPKIVHRLGVGAGRVLDGVPCLGEDVAGHATQRLPHRHARPQGRSLVHCKYYRTFRHHIATKASQAAFASRVTIATYSLRRGQDSALAGFAMALTRGGAARFKSYPRNHHMNIILHCSIKHWQVAVRLSFGFTITPVRSVGHRSVTRGQSRNSLQRRNERPYTLDSSPTKMRTMKSPNGGSAS
jgi:hypothetical protein